MTIQQQVVTGYIHGTGSAENVELGWIPDYVRIVNLTDGDKVHENWLGKVIAFTSGGTTEIKAGDSIVGRTSGATAKIRQVILDSGSWAGGDAAGWFIVSAEDLSSTAWQAEGADLNGVDADAVTISAAADQDGIDIDTEVAATTTAATNVKAYVGSSGANAKGFTVGATISEDGKLLGFVAVRGDAMVDQASTVW